MCVSSVSGPGPGATDVYAILCILHTAYMLLAIRESVMILRPEQRHFWHRRAGRKRDVQRPAARLLLETRTAYMRRTQ